MADHARALAFKILKDAGKHATYSNIAINRALTQSELSDVDKGLVTATVMGVTERQLTLDHIIDKLAANSQRIDADTRALLRMGIYQLFCLDKIPDYAAVNETVNMAPRRSRGFVNAIMRSFLRRRDGEGVESFFPDEKSDPIAHLSLRYSFPEDVCRRFLEIYGYDRAKEIFEIFNRPPKLTLRINTLKISREKYALMLDEKGIKYTLSERLENAILLENVSFTALPGFDEGLFFVQDEASQICVEALDAQKNMLMIDACSCPGSKSFGSAIKMENTGNILSFDLHESKLKLIDKSAERLGIDVITASVRDGRSFDEKLEGQADRVLCDVPCSGLGVIAKKPEIRYKSIADFARLPEIQLAILENCSRYVKKGGVLVYSTCTVLPEENEENVEKFLSAHPEFEICDFEVGGVRSERGMLSLSPDKDGTDGFFVSKFTRK
ncbi:MAG: 16S rRNA (cytosine(967)-C(5))-methyltransferase RsmB [Clostridia bacterium]|nr:16S rRNA (cytosine(967)-C(5))-methyltransferase RsmB [Clostridia bacterium]